MLPGDTCATAGFSCSPAYSVRSFMRYVELADATKRSCASTMRASTNEITLPGFRTVAVQVKWSPSRAGRIMVIFISVLAMLDLRSRSVVTTEAPIAESAMAARNPPCTMPAGLRKRSSTCMVQTETPGWLLSTHVRPRVRSQFGGICRVMGQGYLGRLPSRPIPVTTLVAMTADMFHGASELEGRAIREIAAVAMDAPAMAKSGHSGTAMALAPLGVMLFSRVLRHDPTDPLWSDRDRFILSNGHASILQYGLAHCFGYDVTPEDLRGFRQAHSRTPGHPENGLTATVEVTTGPLGQGIANGVGMAIAERVLRAENGQDLVNHRVWVIAGDGCLEEGVSHEASSLAGSLGLDRLTVFYDDNHITIDGPTELALHDNVEQRFSAYGWHVINLGEQSNDLDALEAATRAAIAETSRPTLIVVRSHIGFPSPEMMDKREAHGSPFSASAITVAKGLLGVPDVPFTFDPDLPAQLVESLNHQQIERTSWEERLATSGDRGVLLLEQLQTNGAAVVTSPPEPFSGGSMVATRKAMQLAMDVFAPQCRGVIGGSADLTENTVVVLAQSKVQAAVSYTHL